MATLYERALQQPWVTVGEDVQYYFDNTDGTLFFKYTDSYMDWIHDFEAWITPYRDMPIKWYAHRGFMSMFKSARDEIRKVYPYVKRIVGYSLGGALAQACAEDYYFMYRTAVTVITFGSPRLFWLPPQYIKDALAKATHYQVKNDIVTMVPLWLWGYVHVGTKIKIPGKTWYPAPINHYPEFYRQITIN
jgi:hypothetical protein